MDGDILRDDDPVQHPRRTGEERVRAAAAVAGEEAVGWDDDGDVGRVPHLLGVGYHLGLGQRHLPGKDLHALDADGAVAGLGGHEVTDRVGGLRGVVLVQRESTGGVVRVTSSALPSASVRRVAVKPLPLTVTVTPSTGLD